MGKCRLGIGILGMGVWLFAAGTASANVLVNPGFEVPDASGGDVYATTGNSGWLGFGPGAFITRTTARSGLQSFKTFGAPGGAFQDFASNPGEVWTGTVWGQNLSTDPMTGTQAGFINIEWHSGTPAAPGPLISFVSTKVVDSTSPFDMWIFGSVSDTAPAGATVARLVLLGGPFNGSGAGGGASFFDDATFVVPEPGSALAVLAGMAPLVRRYRRTA
jgi:hypothetical protein